MPLFLVERNFAEKLKLSSESMHQISDITEELGARWLYSFSAPTGRRHTASTKRKIRSNCSSMPRSLAFPPMSSSRSVAFGRTPSTLRRRVQPRIVRTGGLT